jgi:hypothetical protein
MAQQNNQKKGSSRKVGRNKRSKDLILSQFVRGKISGESYFKQKKLSSKG